LKALPSTRADRVFFLTARGTGRALALDAALAITHTNYPRRAGPPLRIVELVAREKACVHPDRACHGASCPLAAGFYDRLPAARTAARDVAVLTTTALADVARAHDVCPYHLAREMARWCDVAVGDYNHWFDGFPLLAALADENAWRPVVLVDEAHQLLDRARTMFSMRLDAADVAVARALAGDASKRSFTRLVRAWNRVAKALEGDYRVLDGLPRDLVAALEDVTATIGHRLDDGQPLAEAVQRFHFDALHLLRLAEQAGDHSIVDVVAEAAADRRERRLSIGVRNVVPAPLLKARFDAAHATVLFSATMSPHAFYADLLGLPDETMRVDVPSPFASDQLAVRIARHISTRRRDRDASIAPIVALIGERFAARRGNYLVFASSHDYLERVADAFALAHPQVACWRQQRRMGDDARAAFLARFRDDGAGIGFAVLGGVFAEGIDLPGERLVGAFVATLGMPPFDEVHAEFSRRHAERFGAGYEYTYLFPGIRKVVQAAGRVIRSLDDRGSLDLIDDRFARPEVKALLPAWWGVA
jgi:DNA excision repair protein ERCC-2